MNRLMVLVALVAPLVIATAAPAYAEDDALAKAKAGGVLHVCVDAYNFPASMKDADPPGYDIDILRAIAKRAGLHLDYVYPDTGTRGGLGRALRTSISDDKCTLFMGLGVGPDSADELREKHLVLTRPYMSLGFVLVVQGPAEGKAKLNELNGTKLGVAMTTPADDYLFVNHLDRALYFRDRMILKALDSGEINAALLWSSDLAYLKKDYPNGVKFHPVAGYQPEGGLRWNIAIAVPAGETALRTFLDEQIGELSQSGETQRIVESYGIPFLPPIE